ncbi:MAG TPA: hypothetical protein VFS84_15115, partial [Candidatus Binatia bacterium]|nr:hypothetical protein [Candidatus Binatia bacterium]
PGMACLLEPALTSRLLYSHAVRSRIDVRRQESICKPVARLVGIRGVAFKAAANLGAYVGCGRKNSLRWHSAINTMARLFSLHAAQRRIGFCSPA